MRQIYYVLLVGLLLSSCALNKVFLAPYKLETSSSFKAYIEEVKDTLTLSFAENKGLVILNSAHEKPNLKYTVDSRFFKNSEGDSLNMWIYKPEQSKNGITIYFLHGNGGNNAYHSVFVTPFVNAGFTVYLLDYSGFGFSQGKPTRKNVYHDAIDGLNYVISKKDSQDKLIIYGQSLGGHLAAVIGTENQDKIDELIIEGAFSSHKDIAGARVPVLGRIFTREMYSAKKSIPYLLKPLLIIHSTEDKTIPYTQGEKLFQVATEPKLMYTIDKQHIRGPIFYPDSIIYKIKNLLE